MMRRFGWVLMTAVVALTACSSKQDAADPANAAAEATANVAGSPNANTALALPADANLHMVMKHVMEPHAETVWNIMSAAYNDVGDALDPGKLGASDWQQIADSSQLMKERAETLASMQRVLVSDGSEPIMGGQDFGQKGPHGAEWDPVNAAVVQKRIDAQPALFREKAKALVDAADQMNLAARTRNAKLFYHVATELDEVCDGCHEVFWGTDIPPTPKQKLPNSESMTAQQ